MELELRSPLTLTPNSFSVLIGPDKMLVDSLNYNLKELERLQVLCVSGNYSRILDKLDRRFTELDIRRAFTTYQLMTVLKEAYQTLIILEHDPSLFEDATEMAEYVGQALKEVSNRSSVLVYSPWTDRHLDEISKFADRVFVFNEVHKYVHKRSTKKVAPGPRGQKTLGAF
jgi:DNA polymerase I